MTGRVVSPLVFPVSSGGRTGRPAAGASSRRVAVPTLPEVPTLGRPVLCAASIVEDHGRVTVGGLLPALGWDTQTRLAVRLTSGLILVTGDVQGRWRPDRKRRLSIPVGIRRWCGLRPGCPVLLVAEPAAGRLVVHPPAALDALIARRHAEVFGGDRA